MIKDCIFRVLMVRRVNEIFLICFLSSLVKKLFFYCWKKVNVMNLIVVVIMIFMGRIFFVRGRNCVDFKYFYLLESN